MRSKKNLRRRVDNILDIEDARQLLEPHMDCLVAAAHSGLLLYSTLSAEQLGPMRMRTKKGYLNDAIVAAAIKLLDGVKGVVPNTDYEGTFLVLNGRLALRYKYVSAEDRTSNAQTKRQQKVNEQQLQFPGMETLTTVTFGYRLDDAWQEFRQLKILCVRNDSILWSIPIFEFGEGHVLRLPESTADVKSGPVVRSNRRRKTEGAS
ncbi:MAG: hypothetical protein WD648_14205 [Planctomycetaceae bacterium]